MGGLPLSPVLAQTTTQCQENDVLLEIQISYQPSQMNEYLDISVQGPRLPTTPTNQNNIESFSYTQRLLDNGTLVTDNSRISLCVPEDQCLLVGTKLFSSFPVYYEDYRYQLPPDDVSIEYNGQVWSDKKGPFAYSIFGTMIVAELGPCGVVCESEDALLEIEAITGYTLDYDWQILDDATGKIIQHCPAPFQNSSSSSCYWDSEQYYHERLCLPQEGCYTLLVAERSSANLEFDAKSLHVYFDGNHIESFEYLQFINVALSDGSTVCNATGCDSDSTLVELYFFRQDLDLEENRNLTWSLSTVDDGIQLPGDLGMGIITSDDRALHYHKECIPKVDSCIQLSTLVTEDTAGADSWALGIFNATYLDEVGAYQENVTFRFAVDGIIYSDYYFDFGYSDAYINGTFEFANFAGDCSYSHICGNVSEFHVLQVDILTQPIWRAAAVSFEVSSETAAGGSSILYNLAPFYPDQKYRFFSCIHESWLSLDDPDPEYCTKFAVSEGQFFEGYGSYSISLNGVPVTDQQTTGTGMYFNTYGRVTRLAGQCTVGSSSSEGTGTRVGLIVGCVFAALFAIIGVVAYGKLQTQRDVVNGTPSLAITETTAMAIPIVEEQYPSEAGKHSTLTPQDSEATHTGSGSNENVVHESDHEAQA